mmetsp:Transcript_19520/g.19562  ORF Transcript_19520/g.19562 Transcript_19520/m.19562 type:complete len:492 (+) Transcript_19520:91-1566(+)|eukprot:CAMPEP_0202942052 /NCGR_PEP_ID=MMETSP1395-20130829/2223_1 /ASSEMBLY_ACC=CAM_ASM_000871 /TAXON_ID=5961 /ORGANISM="Blepharisma japonicum, Strain Stock R1072" /LENGTH=491 /DNA_ID=CAMNT_0049637897 /DNA_START=91 /DNA_END=1566 /DNA_ORIENTATION=+
MDENCSAFDSEDENKLVYTEIHDKFKELIDSLLENLCREIGVTPQQFVNVCGIGMKSPAHRRIFEQIIACDNFMSFKKLMLKRNKEIEMEVAKLMSKTESPTPAGAEKEVKEQAEMAQAITLSLAAEEERKRKMDREEEELQRVLRLSEEEFKRKQDQEAQRLAALKKLEDEKAMKAKKQQEEEKAAKAKHAEEEKAAKAKQAEEEKVVKSKHFEEEKAHNANIKTPEEKKGEVVDEAGSPEGSKKSAKGLKDDKKRVMEEMKQKELEKRLQEERKEKEREQEAIRKKQQQEEEHLKAVNDAAEREIQEQLREQEEANRLKIQKELELQEKKVKEMQEFMSRSSDKKNEENKSLEHSPEDKNHPDLRPIQKRKQGPANALDFLNENSREKTDELGEEAQEIAKKSSNADYSHEPTGVETLAQRAARLKRQRDELLARKRQERDNEMKQHVANGGSDFSVRKDMSHLPPIITQEEIEKRRNIYTKIKQEEPL